MYQNMCAVPEFNSGLLLSMCRRVSIHFLIFSTTDSKWIVQSPPSFENIYWMLYYIITRSSCKKHIDSLYSVSRILHASDSWVWKNRQEDFENAHYSPLHVLRVTTCLVHTNYYPRFFWEHVHERVPRSAGQFPPHIVERKKNYFLENVRVIVFHV